jgi:hypothetical protein
MSNRGLLWGLALGVLAALIILILPTSALESLVRGTGLAALLPAAAPPLGGTARFMLAALAFAVPTVIGALIGSQRDDYDRDDTIADARPMPVAEQMVAAPAIAPAALDADLDTRLTRIEAALAELPSLTTRALKTSPSADLDKTLRSLQRSLRKRLPDPAVFNAIRSMQSEAGPEALLARLEALETRIGDQLAELNARLAALGSQGAEAPMPPVVRLPTRRPNGLASRRLGDTVADIRRSIESLNA